VHQFFLREAGLITGDYFFISLKQCSLQNVRKIIKLLFKNGFWLIKKREIFLTQNNYRKKHLCCLDMRESTPFCHCHQQWRLKKIGKFLLKSCPRVIWTSLSRELRVAYVLTILNLLIN